MNPLSGYSLRIMWDEQTGLFALFCKCNLPTCCCGIRIEKHEYLGGKKNCSPRREMYLLYRYLINKSMQPQVACNLLVSDIVAEHRLHVIKNNSCDGGFCHDRLYIAARLVEEFRLRNYSMINELLNDMYGCEHSFDRLLSGVLDTQYYAYDFGSRILSIRVLKYLLAAAYSTKMRFYHGGQLLSMPDVPLSSGELPLAAAGRSNGGRLVRSLLTKYGAAPPPPPDEEYDSD